jgi:hypothetical protein
MRKHRAHAFEAECGECAQECAWGIVIQGLLHREWGAIWCGGGGCTGDRLAEPLSFGATMSHGLVDMRFREMWAGFMRGICAGGRGVSHGVLLCCMP